MRGDSINSLLQMQAYRRAEMEGTIAKRDVYGETKAFVEMWRKNNGLEGTKALPPRNEVPFQWMLPFLDKVQTTDTVPSPLVAQIGGQGPHTNLKMYDGKLRPYMGAAGVGDVRLKTPIPRTEKAEAKNDEMMIADRTYTAADAMMPTTKGYYLGEEDGIYGHVLQNEGGYLREGKMYDEGIHGLPVPLI